MNVGTSNADINYFISKGNFSKQEILVNLFIGWHFLFTYLKCKTLKLIFIFNFHIRSEDVSASLKLRHI